MNIQQVQAIIAEAVEKHNGIVKKEELTRLGIDYRRIDELVREGKLVRIRNGYYTDRVEGFSEDALMLGASTIELGGNTFGIYDKERVICDCLKYESRLDRNDFKAAIQSYIADTDKDISVLMDYARARRVVKKVQSFIGVWL